MEERDEGLRVVSPLKREGDDDGAGELRKG